MNWVKQFFAGLLIVLPIGIAMVVPLGPIPFQLSDVFQELNKAEANDEKNNEQTAISEILLYTPWRSDLWKRLGRIQLDNSDYTESIVSFQKANLLLKNDLEIQLWLADALISANEKEEAKNILRNMTQFEKADDFILLQTSLLQIEAGDSFGAQVTLLEAYSNFPNNSDIDMLLGLQLSTSQPDSAVKFLSEASVLDSTKKEICETLIKVITESENSPSSVERFIYIGQTLSTFQYWDLAQIAFSNATLVDPRSAVAWALLSESAQQNGQDGYEYLSQAQKLDPDNEIVNGESGLYYRRQNKNELAIQYFQKAAAINPKSATWELEIANTYAIMGDLQKALIHYQAAIDINPEDWQSLKSMAVFCIKYNYQLQENGLPAARKALTLNPDSPVLMDLLGAGFLAVGDLDSAERFFLQANEVDPNQTPILIHLGQLYIEKGEKETANQYLLQAVEFAPDERLRDLANSLILENSGN